MCSTRRFALRLTRTVSVLSALALGGAAQAHEFWLETAAPLKTADGIETGGVVAVHARLGEPFQGETVVRDRRMIERFFVVEPDGSEKPVLGRDGADPIGIVRLDQPGLHIVGFRSVPRTIEHTPGGFAHYVQEDGLAHLVGKTRADGPTLESYSRCAKRLVRISGDASAGEQSFTQRLEFPLELTPVTDPFRGTVGADEGNRSTFVLEYNGKPCPGALVVAVQASNPDGRLTARTDEAGQVEFPLMSGETIVSAVHMVMPASGTTASADAEWVSFWASLTFDCGSGTS